MLNLIYVPCLVVAGVAKDPAFRPSATQLLQQTPQAMLLDHAIRAAAAAA